MTQEHAKPRLTRRTALRTGAASAAVAVLGALPRAALAAQPASTIGQLEPDAGRWMTWVIDSGSDLRPPPPDIGATRSEIDALQVFAAERDAATLDQVSY